MLPIFCNATSRADGAGAAAIALGGFFLINQESAVFASHKTPATNPATSAPSFLDQQRQNERDAQDECNSMTVTATLHRDAVARVFVEQGRLAVEIGGFDAPQLTRINVSDSGGMWLVLAKETRGPRAARPRPMLLLNRYDFDQKDPQAIWATYLNVNPHSISLSAESLEQRINFSEGPADTTLAVNDIDSGVLPRSTHLTFTARNLGQLRNEHPAEYRKFLLPVLGKLTDTSRMLPGVSDLYEVFPEIPADEASARELGSLLPALDSTVPAERNAATDRIRAMGGRGILAAMRMDLSTMTPQQQTALMDVIAQGRRAKVQDRSAALRDPDFLLDCLEIDAPGIKPAALRALEKVLGRSVAFDPALRGPAAEAAADALRRQILGNSPTTEPSD